MKAENRQKPEEISVCRDLVEHDMGDDSMIDDSVISFGIIVTNRCTPQEMMLES